jgi:hypothetical protein
MDELAKKIVINKNNRLPNSDYTLLIYVKMSVRKSCLKN